MIKLRVSKHFKFNDNRNTGNMNLVTTGQDNYF